MHCPLVYQSTAHEDASSIPTSVRTRGTAVSVRAKETLTNGNLSPRGCARHAIYGRIDVRVSGTFSVGTKTGGRSSVLIRREDKKLCVYLEEDSINLDPTRTNSPVLDKRQALGDRLQNDSVLMSPCRSQPGRLAGKFFRALHVCSTLNIST